MSPVILASASPRRRELLARLVWPFATSPADLDESRLPKETPSDYVGRLAASKALAVSERNRGAWVLGSDTTVVCDDDVLGKPTDALDASRMLQRLSGRVHEVRTAIAWARGGDVVRAAESCTRVRFRALTDGEIERYVATGEPADKAGAYAIQGGAGRFIDRVEGSVTGVIGLPVSLTANAAREIGVPLADGELPPEAVSLRLRAVAGEVAARAVATGRSPDAVRVVAVVKGQPIERIQAAIAAGARCLGENYVQEAQRHRDALAAPPAGLQWHLIGPLQRNKVEAALRCFDLVHTVDRIEVARAIDAHAVGVRDVLLQINVAGDPAKAGVPPERARGLLDAVLGLPRLRVRGLMTIGPQAGAVGGGDPGPQRWFAELRGMFDELRGLGYEHLDELSMGMSGDYAAAIAAGATLVRIGSAILGERQPRAREIAPGREQGRGMEREQR